MNWIQIAYLLSLIFLSTKLEDPARRDSFRAAWITFALIPFWQVIMHLCRAGNIRDSENLRLIDIWDQAVPCLLLGISLVLLSGVVVPSRGETRQDGQ